MIGIQPDYAAAHFNVGLLYQASDKPKEADTHINEALALDPSLADRLATEPVTSGSPAANAPGASATPSA